MGFFPGRYDIEEEKSLTLQKQNVTVEHMDEKQKPFIQHPVLAIFAAILNSFCDKRLLELSERAGEIAKDCELGVTATDPYSLIEQVLDRLHEENLHLDEALRAGERVGPISTSPEYPFLEHIRKWVDGFCMFGEGFEENATRLYAAYKSASIGEQYCTQYTFGRTLKALGYDKRARATGNWWKGVKLKNAPALGAGRYVSLEEAGRILNRSQQTITNKIREGTLHGRRVKDSDNRWTWEVYLEKE